MNMEVKTKYKNRNSNFYEALIFDSKKAHKILIEILEDEKVKNKTGIEENEENEKIK